MPDDKERRGSIIHTMTIEVNPKQEELIEKLEPLNEKLRDHALYSAITKLDHVKEFMQGHMVCVWDFMTLVTKLQEHFTCCTVPWKLKSSALTRRFINEVVLGEESDTDQNDQAISHYELYYKAMKDLGASTDTIDKVTDVVEKYYDNKQKLIAELKKIDVPVYLRDQVVFTLDTAINGKIHETAALFTYGRENLIPDMFLGILHHMRDSEMATKDETLDTLIFYLDRHVEVDGEDHGPISRALVSDIAVDNDEKWEEIYQASKKALELRIAVWDGLLAAVNKIK